MTLAIQLVTETETAVPTIANDVLFRSTLSASLKDNHELLQRLAQCPADDNFQQFDEASGER